MQGSLSFTIQTIIFANPITNIDMEEGVADRVAEDDIVNPDTVWLANYYCTSCGSAFLNYADLYLVRYLKILCTSLT